MAELARTPLYDLHVELGARMVPFAGFEMPVQYPMGVLKEHLFTRDSAGLFDVSHMGQLIIEGEGAEAALEALIPIDLASLAINKQSYGFFCDAEGGILDDLMVVRWGDERFFMVVNAACVADDIAHLKANLPPSVTLTHLQDRALVALQGPMAAAVLADMAPESAELVFMEGAALSLAGIECYVTRSGYTGEDGFEISVPNDAVLTLAQKLLSDKRVAAIGLGARDSLRLEAGLCLYGHDLDTSISPIEGGLQWAIHKSRRPGGTKAGGYLGAERVHSQLASGVGRKRVGLEILSRAPVREGSELFSPQGLKIGAVCSGGFSPTLGAPIAMAYVAADCAEIGTALVARVRNKEVAVKVCQLPFVKQNYVRRQV